MGYIYLALAIVLELCGTTCMKLSNGFENKFFAAGTLIFFGVCFYFSALSMKTIPLNIAYATWSGLGIVLAAVIAKIFFYETISTPGLIGIVLIVVGVVLCNFFGATK
ncbi:MAG: multidrug efflux SMR transporter [Selenomonadaceae bacterium]|nr:multidrug efflux SMR transporter [Selenomonadaceae bacterium]